MVAGEAIEALLPSPYESEVYPVVPAMAPDRRIELRTAGFGDLLSPRPSGVKRLNRLSNNNKKPRTGRGLVMQNCPDP